MAHPSRARSAPRRRLLAAVVTALAALGGTIAVAPTAGAAPVDVTGGTLEWGVKATFRSYVTGQIAHGSITTAGGATQASGNGVFTFPVESGSHDGAASTTDADSGGSVHFVGHDGILDTTIADIRVDVDGATGALIADVVSREFINTTTAGPFVTYDDVELVSLNLTGITPTTGTNSVTYAAVPSVLTEDGAEAFGGFYPAGTAFDPVTFTLTLEEDEPEPSLGNLTWKVSQHAWTSSSLAPSHAAGAPAVKDPANGFVFPASAVSYDPDTGETDVAFDGSLTLGNVSQGGYKIELAQPRIVIDDAGAGLIEADVRYCTGGAGAVPCSGTWASGSDLTVTTFTAVTPTVAGNHVSWTATPHWATVGETFNAEFVDFLDGSLRAHFRTTATPNANKPPAPLVVEFDYEPPAPEGVSDSVDITTTVEPGGLTISVADDEVVLPTPTLDAAGTALETTGVLDDVTVVDTRATDPGWNVTSQITDFTGPEGTFDGESLGWAPGVTSSSPGQVVTAGAAVAPGAGLNGAQLASAAAGSGLGSAVLDADLTLEVPTNTPPGTYSATLTVTAI